MKTSHWLRPAGLISVLFIGMLFCSDAAEPMMEPWFARKVTSIRVPEFKIETASAFDAFSFIAQKVLELDPDPDPRARGISFFTVGDIASSSRTIDYHKSDVAVDTLLKDMANLYNVDIHITVVGVIMCAAGVSPFPNHKAATGTVFRSYKPKLSQ